MRKALIAYFSQNGSTARVGETIARGLRAEGYQVHLHNVNDGPAPSPGGYDLLGIGSPVFYFRPPFLMQDYVDALPKLRGIPAFVYVVHGTYRGDTASSLRKTLSRKGARDIGQFASLGYDTFFSYIKEGFLFSHRYPRPEDFDSAEGFGREVAARASGKPFIPESPDPRPRNIYRLERFFTNRWLTRHIYSRLFTVDVKKCKGCGLCARACPTRNIVLEAPGLLKRGRACILCLGCEAKCPEGAITSPVSWPMFRPFMMYNVYHASRDLALEYVRVLHSRGRTRFVKEGENGEAGAAERGQQ